MNISLKYGSGKIVIPEDGLHIKEVAAAGEVSKLANPSQRIKEVLAKPINTLPFHEIFKEKDQVLIVISDITRSWINYPVFLPYIVNELNYLGIKDEDITFLTATGTHRKQSEEEKSCLVGEEIYSRFPIIDHDSLNHEMIFIGKTNSGNEVFVNALVKDKRILLTGGIAPHLMSGFGGGRKSLLPGISSYDTIQRNHLLTLDPKEARSNPLTGVGSLDTNPLHKDMTEACALLNPDFLINVTTNDNGELAEIFAGHWYDAWFEGTQWIRRNFFVPIKGRTDLVITSCGGYPKDINLYQTAKTIFNAVKAVKDGGSLLLLSQCSDGAGADSFFNWIIPLKNGTLDEELRKDFTIPGYVFYAILEAAKKIDLYLLSEMNPSDIIPMGLIPCKDIDEAMRKIKEKHQEPIETMILPYGGSTVPIV